MWRNLALLCLAGFMQVGGTGAPTNLYGVVGKCKGCCNVVSVMKVTGHYLFTYLLAYLLHGAESSLRS
jgi:hypothetical protein